MNTKDASSFLRNINDDTIIKLKQAFKSQIDVDNLDDISLYHKPFPHFAISNLITNDAFLNDLRKDLLKSKFNRKNNDLYKFNQTGDLGKSKSQTVLKFKDLLYGKFLNFLNEITDINLIADKIDMTCSKYEYADYLLCHDDDIQGDEYGRRIAFIFYLVPLDWNEKDGGCLDLFDVNENLQPINVVKSLTPIRNRILFFEVSDRSFHQVSEVLNESKTRLSINGWFHGPINYRPPAFIELFQNPKPLINITHDLFFEWIEEKYLDPVNQNAIQENFAESSEIKLDKVFNAAKYEKLKNALKCEDINWILKGPKNRRNYEVANEDSLPDILKEFVKILKSDLMGVTLSNLTGLTLHPSCKNTKTNENQNKTSNCEYSDDSIDSCSEAKPCTSKSIDDDKILPPNKKLKIEKNKTVQNDTNSTCYCEIRRWKHGFYTLITDDDSEMQVNGLDLMLFFNSENYDEDYGGNISYLARDEDNELLTIFPEDNCLALVYRDEETLRFTKYINSKFNDTSSNSSNDNAFYEISIVYYE